MNEDFAYAAGIIDGEGCIGIYKHRDIPSVATVVAVSMTDRNVVEWLKKMFGGAVYIKKGDSKRDIAYTWRLGDRKDIAELMYKLHPYLKVKRVHAVIMKEFCERFPKRRSDPALCIQEFEKYCAVMKSLNGRGPGAAALKAEIAETILGK